MLVADVDVVRVGERLDHRDLLGVAGEQRAEREEAEVDDAALEAELLEKRRRAFLAYDRELQDECPPAVDEELREEAQTGIW